MADTLIFDDLGNKVFTQYQEGRRDAIFTTLSTPPTIGQPVLLCELPFIPIERQTENDFIRITQDGSIRITDTIANQAEIFTQIVSYYKLDCFTSNVNSYILKFG